MTEVVVPRETRVPIRATRGVLHFDPRVKLAMLVVANMMMFLHVGPYAGMMGVLLFSLPMLCGGKIALGMGMPACDAMCLGVDWLAAAVADAAPWLHVPGALAAGGAMMLPCLIAGMSAFATTPPGELVAALRRLHLPDAVVIPAIVLLRFFPTIARDYRMIRCSMRLRGINVGGWAMLCHPMRSLEYVLVPLLMNAANAAHDLTVSALTKGLGRRRATSSSAMLHMQAIDWAMLALCCLPLIPWQA